MKQTPELDRIQEKMKPGVLTLKGFLGHDDRKLADIIAADQLSLANYNLDIDRVCARLVEITDKGRDLMEEEVLVEDRYRVRVRDDRGKIPSPWNDGLFEKGDVELVDNRSGKKLKWNLLTLRLASAHGFLGGIGSEYRLEPADLSEIIS